MQATATRTLVKSKPELWERLESEDVMSGCAHELGLDSQSAKDVEVLERELGERLAWRAGPTRFEVSLSEKAFGTQVSVAVSGEPAVEESALERMLDELAEPQKRPFSSG